MTPTSRSQRLHITSACPLCFGAWRSAGILRSTFGWEEPRIVHRLKALAKTAEIVRPTIALQVIGDDPDDDRVLDCAVAGKADLIVSGDRHLRRLKSFQGIGIVTPADFKRTLGS